MPKPFDPPQLKPSRSRPFSAISRIRAWMAAALTGAVALSASPARAARVPEPDAVLYGAVEIDFDVAPNTTVTADSLRTIKATIGGVVVAEYPMGYYASAANNYLIRLPLESRTGGEGVEPGKAYPGDTVVLWADDIELESQSSGDYTLPGTMKDARGKLTPHGLKSKGTVSRPDLRVISFGVGASSISAGQILPISGEVKNDGSKDSAPFDVTLIGSTSPAFTNPVELGKAEPVMDSTLNSGASYFLDGLAIQSYGSIPGGTYHVKLMVDGDNKIVEILEKSNNEATAAATVTISNNSGARLPDLAINHLDFELLPDPSRPNGLLIAFKGQIVNNTLERVPGIFHAKFWGSGNMAAFQMDLPLSGEFMIQPLNGGKSFQLASIPPQPLPPLPPDLNDVDLRVGLLVDSLDEIKETQEINNFAIVGHHLLRTPRNGAETWTDYE